MSETPTNYPLGRRLRLPQATAKVFRPLVMSCRVLLSDAVSDKRYGAEKTVVGVDWTGDRLSIPFAA